MWEYPETIMAIIFIVAILIERIAHMARSGSNSILRDEEEKVCETIGLTSEAVINAVDLKASDVSIDATDFATTLNSTDASISSIYEALEPWFNEIKYASKPEENINTGTNCCNCGAALPSNGVCDYCGTDNNRRIKRSDPEPLPAKPTYDDGHTLLFCEDNYLGPFKRTIKIKSPDGTIFEHEFDIL